MLPYIRSFKVCFSCRIDVQQPSVHLCTLTEQECALGQIKVKITLSEISVNVRGKVSNFYLNFGQFLPLRSTPPSTQHSFLTRGTPLPSRMTGRRFQSTVIKAHTPSTDAKRYRRSVASAILIKRRFTTMAHLRMARDEHRGKVTSDEMTGE